MTPLFPPLETQMSEKKILLDRLHDIEARLSEVMIELANLPRDGSYEHQEKQTERNELLTSKRVTERALRDLAAPPAKPNKAREKFIANEVATRRQDTLAFIEKLERAGDHRQARLWRGELIGLREQIEKEFSA